MSPNAVNLFRRALRDHPSLQYFPVIHLQQLALALAGLDADAPEWNRGLRAALDQSSALGLRAVHLDAAAPVGIGVRPRDLDRSARRDVAASLRRAKLAFAGLDLPIPAAHFADHASVDRAVAAVIAAIDLAAELRALTESTQPVVSLSLPENTDTAITKTLAEKAERAGVRLADHAAALTAMRQPRQSQPLSAARTQPITPQLIAAAPNNPSSSPNFSTALGIGLDPADLLLAGIAPEAAAAKLGADLASARLSDLSSLGRIAPGEPGGRLDLPAYLAALSIGYINRPIILDLRGIKNPTQAITKTLEKLDNLTQGQFR